MDDEERQAYESRIEDLENQLSMMDFPDNSEKLTSEKNFELLAGKDEIPAKYKDVFDYILAISTQWMYVQTKDEEEDWIEECLHSFDTYKLYNPRCGFNEHDRMAIRILLRRRLNRAYQGFERTGINTTIQQINYQTTPVLPTGTKRESLLSKLNPFKK